MKPIGDIIMIRPDDAKVQTDSGILIQEDWKTLPPTGEVVAVGQAVTAVKAGDKVVFMRYAVIDALDGLKAAKERHIMAVVDEQA